MGMGRGGGQTAINRIDRRPKSLLVAGFAAEEKDEVMLHLGAIAQIESHDFDVDAMGKPKLVVSFFDRKAAELVATQVRERFQELNSAVYSLFFIVHDVYRRSLFAKGPLAHCQFRICLAFAYESNETYEK